ncbi:aminotransferase class V-fold PLP-dependent enzyme [Bacillus lacus]|uniref:Aminotransferase class V-fold PLP-dependent enzyme n=1 Tax=Metabacillus lacus TaxID=1983721 RepID=A0A7X2J0F7_9BACI|nr:aminotransferase class V-fold PLP-dependent enzyme [Metabacillus lacus]MRX73060.1 aminotransferase class V-fold PLP-dependent enzyme [Metabacillus lacus]
MLYLDNSATTPLLPVVREAMLPYLLEEFGNPSSKYYSKAINATKAIEQARKNVANLLGCKPEELSFTSGSTETNNMVLKGVTDYYQTKGNHIITSKAEHPSILDTCKYLEDLGFQVTYLNVDKYGRVSLDNLKNALSDNTILVSIMWGNNELGSLNPIEEIAALCKESNVFFHTDATQVVGKIDFSLEDLPGISFLSCSAHKFHGPKGTGVTFIRRDEYGVPVPLTPLLHGGGQEGGIRSGTLAVHNIVGMGKAAELANNYLEENILKLKMLEEQLTNILNAKFGRKIVFNNDKINKVPGILNVQFRGVNNEILVKKLAPVIAVSTGSACSSSKPSHVLSSIGLPLEEIRNTIRFSLSHLITEEDLMVFKSL